jgi:GH43 family beta-xylosidase
MMEADEDTDLLDRNSWKKSRYPVLETDYKKNIYGPGHNSFTFAEDGTPLSIYHARDYKKIVGDPLYDPNRHARVMEVKFDDNGKPVFEFY